MSILTDLDLSLAQVAESLNTPVDILEMDAGESKVTEAAVLSSTIIDLYVTNNLEITALGVPDPTAMYSVFLGSLSSDGAVGDLSAGDIATALLLKINEAKQLISLANKDATKNASSTQALASVNMDIPEVSDLVGGLWSILGSYTVNAPESLLIGLSHCVDWLTDSIDQYDPSPFNITDQESAQDLVDIVGVCLATFSAMNTKITSFSETVSAYSQIIAVYKEGVALSSEVIGSVASALASTSQSMDLLVGGSSVIASTNPILFYGLQAVTEKKKELLTEASGDIDLEDDASVSSFLGSRVADVYLEAKSEAFSKSGLSTLKSSVDAQVASLFNSLELIEAPMG